MMLDGEICSHDVHMLEGYCCRHNYDPVGV